jgi:hypothetical protein
MMKQQRSSAVEQENHNLLVAGSNPAAATNLDRLMTLEEAARLLPGATHWTLRAEHKKGRLPLYKIGKRLYTTPRDMRELQEQCRVQPKAPVSTWSAGGDGSSATDQGKSALAALRARVGTPRPSLGDTSPPSTPRLPAASGRPR